VYLKLAGNNIEAQGSSAIADLIMNNQSLRCLDISGNPIGYDGLNVITSTIRKNGGLNRIIVDPAYTDQLDIAIAKEQIVEDLVST
jgi:Ran GTPase-activating protein (RanGAP) involved in mRNA processing and transport